MNPTQQFQSHDFNDDVTHSKIAFTVRQQEGSSLPSHKKGMKLLPVDFAPSNYSVFCGRGKGSYNSIGNRRLRVTVSMFLDQYNEAEGMTTERSRIITKVMRIMSECCPIGAFIKFENGRYWQLSEKASREKVSALFRDCSQAQAQTKTNKPNNKRIMNTRRGSMVEGYLYDVALVVSGKKRLSMNDSASSSSTSKRSFYDIDTKQMVSLANYDDEVSVGSAGSVLLC